MNSKRYTSISIIRIRVYKAWLQIARRIDRLCSERLTKHVFFTVHCVILKAALFDKLVTDNSSYNNYTQALCLIVIAIDIRKYQAWSTTPREQTSTPCYQGCHLNRELQDCVWLPITYICQTSCIEIIWGETGKCHASLITGYLMSSVDLINKFNGAFLKHHWI